MTHPWSLVGRGIVALIFGLIFVFYPGATLVTLAVLFPIFLIIDAVIVIIMAIVTSGKDEAKWAARVPLGIVELVLALIILAWPGLSLVTFIYLVGAWAFIVGIAQFIAAFAEKELHTGARWLYAITGILTVILGILLFVYPIASAAVLVWFLGIYLVIYGIVVAIAGFWGVFAGTGTKKEATA